MEFRRHVYGALSALAATALLAGCASTGAPMPPSLELPKPPTDLRAARKGNKVYLTWSVPVFTTDRQSVRHLGPTRICRSLDAIMSQCGTPVGEAPPPTTTSTPQKKNVSTAQKLLSNYTDTLPRGLEQHNPTTMVTYGVEVLNTNNRGAGLSNQVQVLAAPTLLPPNDFKAQVTADGILLRWIGMPDTHGIPEINHLYRVYRRETGSGSETLVGELQLDTSSEVRLVDRSFAWEKTYDYRATIVTRVSLGNNPPIEVEGDDTSPIKVFAHDIFPPVVPSSLQAVFSGVGQQPFVDLIWEPNTDTDLAGYNVYRREESGQAMKINTDLVKTPAYRDSNVASGKKYFYSVSALDLRGNESARSEETSEAVP